MGVTHPQQSGTRLRAFPSWAFGPDMNVARMGHWSATLPNGRVALFGGDHRLGFTVLDSAEFPAAAAVPDARENLTSLRENVRKAYTLLAFRVLKSKR